VQWRVLVCMFMESAVWTLPLLVLAMMLAPTKAPAAMGLAGMDPPALADGLAAMSWQARLTLSVGAGIYEELLFRLVLITAIHFVLHDLAKLRSGTASVLAAIATAVLFAVYHRAAFGGGPISLDAANWPLLGFYTAAGLFFAALFIVRGFGIVVGTHALYDVLVLVVMPGMRDVG
jgi:membrane protease YdiL (CAAX protease family)